MDALDWVSLLVALAGIVLQVVEIVLARRANDEPDEEP
jgi:hypothetical protein